MNNIKNLGIAREVCWDTYIVESMENARVQMHKPERKNVVLECNEKWEELRAGYLSVLKLGDVYRLYYRSSGGRAKQKECFCVAESTDGKTFIRKPLSVYEYDGAKKNNIMFMDEDRFVDNFSIHVDTNPDCPADEKFKALSLYYRKENGVRLLDLLYYKSADGINFEKVGILDIPGVFDTHNVVIWDEKEKEYKMYFRDFHDADGSRSHYVPDDLIMEPCFRDVRLTRSKDFVHWTPSEMIKYTDGDIHIQMYTNQIIKYPRADVYLGMPVRYANRVKDSANFKYLPDWYGLRTKFINDKSRQGTVATDCVLMTSRDGLTFDRCGEAFFAPRLEKNRNWAYGEGYLSHGIVETVCDENDALTEYSFYDSEGRLEEMSKIVRYTVRLDGFYSWRGDWSVGRVTTVPITFEGDSLEINFSTSGLGHLRITLCDLDGNTLEGYDSGKLFGNSLSRPVDFEKPLSELAGKPVRMKVELKDADLYSFKFNEGVTDKEEQAVKQEDAEKKNDVDLSDDGLKSFRFIVS